MTVSYYYDEKYREHVIENVEPDNDGLFERAMFSGPNARHMAWGFARSYYGSNCAALSAEEQTAAGASPEPVRL